MNRAQRFLSQFGTGLIGISLLLACTTTAPAEDQQGLRVMVQKTTLEKEKERDAFNDFDKVKSSLALRIQMKNIAMTDLPAGRLEWSIVVERWGHSPTLYHLFSGTEDIVTLPKTNEHKLVVGAIKTTNYELSSNRKEFSDEIKAWKLVFKHGETERVFVSGSNFESLAKRAKSQK